MIIPEIDSPGKGWKVVYKTAFRCYNNHQTL